MPGSVLIPSGGLRPDPQIVPPAVGDLYYICARMPSSPLARAQLTNSEMSFIADMFLPIAGRDAIRIRHGQDEDAFRQWQVRREGGTLTITIEIPNQPTLEIVWRDRMEAARPLVTLDEKSRTNRIEIPPGFNIQSLHSHGQNGDLWTHYILSFLTGNRLHPHISNPERPKFDEPLVYPTAPQVGTVEAGSRALASHVDRFLAISPPNTGQLEALMTLTAKAVRDLGDMQRPIHLVLARLTHWTAQASDLLRQEQQGGPQQFVVLGERNVQRRPLDMVVDEALQRNLPTVIVLTTTGFRAFIEDSVSRLVEPTDAKRFVNDFFSRLGKDQQTPYELDQLLQRLLDEGLYQASADAPIYNRPFSTLAAAVRTVSFYEADHMGAPRLFPVISALANTQGCVTLATSNIPVHRHHNIFAEPMQGIVYRALEDSPSYYLGSTVARGVTGSMILEQMATAIHSGIYPPLDHVYFLPAARFLPRELRDDLYIPQPDGRFALNRENPDIYKHLFTTIAPLLEKHQKIQISVSSRDEAVAVTAYLNQLFEAEHNGARRFGYFIDGRDLVEINQSEQANRDFRQGRIHGLVRVQRDDEPPIDGVTCFVDLTRTYNAKRFERRVSDLLKQSEGKTGIDVLCLVEKNQQAFTTYLDLMIAVKAGIFTPPHVRRPAVPGAQYVPFEPGGRGLFLNEAEYRRHLQEQLDQVEHWRTRFWKPAERAVDAADVKLGRTLVNRLQGQEYGTKARILNTAEGRQIKRMLTSYGELLYEALPEEAQVWLDKFRFLEEIREEINSVFVPGRMRDQDSLDGLPVKIGAAVPPFHLDPSAAFSGKALERAGRLVAGYINEIGDIPPRESVIGITLRRGLNSGERFLALLPSAVRDRILEEGLLSLREERNQMYRRFAEDYKSRYGKPTDTLTEKHQRFLRRYVRCNEEVVQLTHAFHEAGLIGLLSVEEGCRKSPRLHVYDGALGAAVLGFWSTSIWYGPQLPQNVISAISFAANRREQIAHYIDQCMWQGGHVPTQQVGGTLLTSLDATERKEIAALCRSARGRAFMTAVPSLAAETSKREVSNSLSALIEAYVEQTQDLKIAKDPRFTRFKALPLAMRNCALEYISGHLDDFMRDPLRTIGAALEVPFDPHHYIRVRRESGEISPKLAEWGFSKLSALEQREVIDAAVKAAGLDKFCDNPLPAIRSEMARKRGDF